MSTLSVDTIQGQTTAANVKMPVGTPIQVVSGNPAGGVGFDTTTGTEFNIFTLNITPKYNTSKILVLCDIGMYMNGDAAQIRGDFMIRRDTTLIRGTESGGTGYFRDGSGRIKSWMTSFNHLDSPSTTSQITYKMAWKGHTHAAGGQFNEHYTSMTLMEIAQ